jgi:hypothetical protein
MVPDATGAVAQALVGKWSPSNDAIVASVATKDAEGRGAGDDGGLVPTGCTISTIGLP